MTNGGTAEDAMEVEEFDGYYEISLRNLSDINIDLLRLEYRIFSEQDNTAKKDRHDVRYTRENGVLEYTLDSRETEMQKTKVVKLVETKLGKGIVWSGGGDLQTKAKMIGIWLRVYHGEDVIHELAQPSTLPKKVNWKE